MNDINASGLGGAGGNADLTQRFSLDTQGFGALRHAAKDDPKAALKTVAKEMNASFLQMMLKSMRDATPSDGLMDSQNGKQFTSMLDSQLTQQLSSKGVGLADSLLKQLGGGANVHGGGAGAGAPGGMGGAGGLHGNAGAALQAQPAGTDHDARVSSGADVSARGTPANAVDRTAGETGAAGATAAAATLQRMDAPSRMPRNDNGLGRVEGIAQTQSVQGKQAPQQAGRSDAWAAGLYRGATTVGAATGAAAVGAADGAAKMAAQGAAHGAEFAKGMRGREGNLAAGSLTNMAAAQAGAQAGTRTGPMTMQQRVAAVEARAMAAGWRPQEGSQTAGLAAEAEEAAAAVGGAGALGAMHAYAAQNKPMAPAQPFEETEASNIRMNGGSAHANAFIEKLAPAAEAASRETGIPAHFILSQVALESGWGKSEIRTPGGARTHNVLGVKAGDGWTGPTVHAYTTEYVHGRPQHVREEFRVYGSYKEALKDYANVLTSNTRYASALRNSNSAAGFANGMQRAGYATDPHYASKLLAIIKQMV